MVARAAMVRWLEVAAAAAVGRARQRLVVQGLTPLAPLAVLEVPGHRLAAMVVLEVTLEHPETTALIMAAPVVAAQSCPQAAPVNQV